MKLGLYEAEIELDDGTRFKICKRIFGEYSSFFKALFRWEDEDAKLYRIKNVKSQPMGVIVDYLQKSWPISSFRSRNDLSRQELEDIFVLIQYFDIKDWMLTFACEKVIKMIKAPSLRTSARRKKDDIDHWMRFATVWPEAI